MERMLRVAGVIGFAMLGSACGGRVNPELPSCPPGVDCPEADTGVSPDSALPDGYVPDTGKPPPDSSYDTWYPPPPDTSTCGSGPCSPGYTCRIPCGSCTCLEGGGWVCSGGTDCYDSGIPDVYPGCPVVEPYDGQFCGGYEGSSCSWANACGTTDYGYCSGGRWSVKADTCPGGCPPYRPIEGSACSSTAPLPYCKYPSACGGTDLAYCTYGRWTFAPSDCPPPPPPPPPCPYSTPPTGSYCADEGIYCKTISSCGGSDVAQCIGHGWKVSPGPCLPPPPPPCPYVVPSDGSYCPSERQECYFPTPCGTSDYAVCVGGGWRVKSSCTGGTCPAYEPVSGSKCSVPSSTMCNYPNPYGCSTSCFCAKDYRWACYDPPCYPPPYDGGGGWVDGSF
jgi:hypothetical protein